MKTIKILTCLFFMSLVSCNNEDAPSNNSQAESNVLLKRYQSYSIEPNTSEVLEEDYTYFYNGNKFNYRIDNLNGEKLIFFYTGNLITKEEIRNSQNDLLAQIDYTYDTNGRVTFYKEESFDNGQIRFLTFEHLADGSVKSTSYNEQSSIPNGYAKLFFQNENFVKRESYNDQNILLGTNTVTYDGKNNPFKNVVGANVYGLTDNRAAGDFVVGTTQNPLSFQSGGLGSNSFNIDNTYTYKYNPLNFPMQENYTSTNTFQSTTTSFSYRSIYTY